MKIIEVKKMNKEIEEKGLIGFFKEGIQNTFTNINSWVDEKILSPIKAKLDIQKPGDLGRKIFDKFVTFFSKPATQTRTGVL